MENTVLELGENLKISVEAKSNKGVVKSLDFEDVKIVIEDEDVAIVDNTKGVLSIKSKGLGLTNMTVSVVNEKGDTIETTLEIEVIEKKYEDFIVSLSVKFGDKFRD